jgi:beta-galactosidase
VCSSDLSRLTTVASRSKYDGRDAMNACTDVIGYNVYRGWYDGTPEGFGRYADTLHRRFPTRAFAISEYGAGASVRQHEVQPKRPEPRGPWHPEEWQATLHEVTWHAMEQRPFLWGTFVWNMFDFASDGRSEGDAMGRNDKGLVTYDRKIRKDAFFWYKANWNPEPMVYLTSRRFTPRPAGPVDVKVYSNCETLTLFVNGVSCGEQAPSGHRSVWSGIVLRPGSNLLRVVGRRGGRTVDDLCEWTGIEGRTP